MQNLQFTTEVEARTSSVYQRLKKVIPEVEWPIHAPLIDRINTLKSELNAKIGRAHV